MRALLQIVSRATVITVSPGASSQDEACGAIEQEVALIGHGILAFVAFAATDRRADLEWVAAKIGSLRVFPSDRSSFDVSLRETGGQLLVVSQFTLLADAGKGRRPDFGAAADAGQAQELYDLFVDLCEAQLPGKVQCGHFGEHMRVHLVNEGPVTLWLER